MPIRIPDHLPARKTLEKEGVVVMDASRSARQDIRPLQIGLLNLMPNKERTETQFARLIGSTPLQIDLTLVRITDLALADVGMLGTPAQVRAFIADPPFAAQELR